MSEPGFVYVLSNSSQPEHVKVGMTGGPVETRAQVLSRETSVPVPFVVEYSAWFQDARAAEAKAHSALRHCREPRKEHFKTDVPTAIVAIESLGLPFERRFHRGDNLRRTEERRREQIEQERQEQEMAKRQHASKQKEDQENAVKNAWLQLREKQTTRVWRSIAALGVLGTLLGASIGGLGEAILLALIAVAVGSWLGYPILLLVERQERKAARRQAEQNGVESPLWSSSGDDLSGIAGAALWAGWVMVLAAVAAWFALTN